MEITTTSVNPQFTDSDNLRKQARLQAFHESRQLIAALPHGTVLDTMSYEDMCKELEHRDSK